MLFRPNLSSLSMHFPERLLLLDPTDRIGHRVLIHLFTKQPFRFSISQRQFNLHGGRYRITG